MPDRRDRPLAVAIDVRDGAARRRLEPLGVDGHAARGQLLDGAMAELVVAESREEVARAVEPRHLHGHHPAAAGRHDPRVGGVGDVPGLRHLVHEDELDPLDVSDDRASHSATALHVSPMMIAVMAPATIPPFERFYVEHRDEVLGYLRRLLGQRAEDAWQETFLRALRAYDRLEHGRHLRAWVFTIATRWRWTSCGDQRPTRRARRRPGRAGAPSAPAYRELEPLTGAAADRARRGRPPLRLRPDLRRDRRRARLVRGRGARRSIVRRPQTEEVTLTVTPELDAVSARPPSRGASSTSATTSSRRRSARCWSRRPRGLCRSLRPGRRGGASALARFGVRVLARRALDDVRRELDEYFEGRRRVSTCRSTCALAPISPGGAPRARAGAVRPARHLRRARAEVGRPRAARAVGTAMNRNPIPIVLPCHRIVGANGSLTGYAGGLHVKRALLELEGATLAIS